MGKLTPLRVEMIKRDIKQRILSARTGINASQISLICTGRLVPTEVQRSKIADVLGKPQEDLFEPTD